MTCYEHVYLSKNDREVKNKKEKREKYSINDYGEQSALNCSYTALTVANCTNSTVYICRNGHCTPAGTERVLIQRIGSVGRRGFVVL